MSSIQIHIIIDKLTITACVTIAPGQCKGKQCTKFSSQWKRWKAYHFALDRHNRQFNRWWGTTLQIRKKLGFWKLERSKRWNKKYWVQRHHLWWIMSSRSDSISPEELCPDVCYPHMLPVGMVRKQFQSVSVFWGRQSRHFLGHFLKTNKEDEQINDNTFIK